MDIVGGMHPAVRKIFSSGENRQQSLRADDKTSPWGNTRLVVKVPYWKGMCDIGRKKYFFVSDDDIYSHNEACGLLGILKKNCSEALRG